MTTLAVSDLARRTAALCLVHPYEAESIIAAALREAEDAALERAAVVAETHPTWPARNRRVMIADAIRALKTP